MARFKPISLRRGGSRSSLFGEWLTIERILRKLSSAKFAEELQPEFEKLGNGIKGHVQTMIDTQGLSWEPLKASTVKRKGHGKVYIDTRFLRDHIKVEFKKTSQRTVAIDIFPEDIDHPSGEPLQAIAAGLEFGKDKQVARPLWRPTLKALPTLRIFREFQEDVFEKILSR